MLRIAGLLIACLGVSGCGWLTDGAFKSSFRDQFARLPSDLGIPVIRVVASVDEDRIANEAVLDLCISRVYAVEASTVLPLAESEGFQQQNSRWRVQWEQERPGRATLPWCASSETRQALARAAEAGATALYGKGRTGFGTAADSSPMTMHFHYAFIDRATNTLHTTFWMTNMGG